MEYVHRNLNDQERKDFVELFWHTVKNKPIMKHVILQKYQYALIYPLILLTLIALEIKMYNDIVVLGLGIIFGIMAIQINFIFSHMWAHALMLEYDLWNINNMNREIGTIPSVMFYAFYHHHHTKADNWAKDILSFYSSVGEMATAISHWESFSLFTLDFPVNEVIMRLFVIFTLVSFPQIFLPFYIGYEIGVILLPISHDWVHDRNSCKVGILYYILKPLEYIGIFATRKDHIRHHIYNHPTVYQGFTSSGLYSKTFDGFIDLIWNKTYHYCNRTGKKMHQVMWYPMVAVLCCVLTIFPIILMTIS